MSEGKILLDLTQSEALVLFEFVSRFTEKGLLNIEHQAEERILWSVCGGLEKQLVEPFRPDYDELLREARDIVADPQELETGSGEG
jgi:hypothetical protein